MVIRLIFFTTVQPHRRRRGLGPPPPSLLPPPTEEEAERGRRRWTQEEGGLRRRGPAAAPLPLPRDQEEPGPLIRLHGGLCQPGEEDLYIRQMAVTAIYLRIKNKKHFFF